MADNLQGHLEPISDIGFQAMFWAIYLSFAANNTKVHNMKSI